MREHSGSNFFLFHGVKSLRFAKTLDNVQNVQNWLFTGCDISFACLFKIVSGDL